MLRIAGAVTLCLAIAALVWMAALKAREVLVDEEADNAGAAVVLLIVIAGSAAAFPSRPAPVQLAPFRPALSRRVPFRSSFPYG